MGLVNSAPGPRGLSRRYNMCYCASHHYRRNTTRFVESTISNSYIRVAGWFHSLVFLVLSESVVLCLVSVRSFSVMQMSAVLCNTVCVFVLIDMVSKPRYSTQ